MEEKCKSIHASFYPNPTSKAPHSFRVFCSAGTRFVRCARSRNVTRQPYGRDTVQRTTPVTAAKGWGCLQDRRRAPVDSRCHCSPVLRCKAEPAAAAFLAGEPSRGDGGSDEGAGCLGDWKEVWERAREGEGGRTGRTGQQEACQGEACWAVEALLGLCAVLVL